VARFEIAGIVASGGIDDVEVHAHLGQRVWRLSAVMRPAGSSGRPVGRSDDA
jgi:hypothetical protein